MNENNILKRCIATDRNYVANVIYSHFGASDDRFESFKLQCIEATRNKTFSYKLMRFPHCTYCFISLMCMTNSKTLSYNLIYVQATLVAQYINKKLTLIHSAAGRNPMPKLVFCLNSFNLVTSDSIVGLFYDADWKLFQNISTTCCFS